MGTSRMALQAGDTGWDTRVIQRQIVVLLEELLKQSSGNAAGLRGMRMLAMMHMMGMSPGGFFGGTNAHILPATLGQAGDESWREVRTRFAEQLGAAFEQQYPAKFRTLLEAYFQHLRNAPPK